MTATTTPTDYRYDVFVSYRRSPLMLSWVTGVVDRMTEWASNALGGPDISVFFDTAAITPGDDWPTRLQEGVRDSRALLAIWCPRYFQSAYCVGEFMSFVHRASEYGSGQLVVPITYHDGEHFPDEAKRIQQFDASDFAGTTGGFWNSPRADELDQKLIPLAAELARAVERAPDYDPDFPIRLEDPWPATRPVARGHL